MRKLLAGIMILTSLNLAAQDTLIHVNPLPDTQISSGSQNGPNTNQKVYNIKPIIDLPLTAAAMGMSLYGMSVIYGRDRVPEAEILALNPNNINSFDRSTADNYDLKAKSASDKFFYGSMPLPLVLLFDKKIRKDGLRVGMLYLQAMGIFGSIYTSSAMIADRFRPYSYNSNVEMARRTRGGVRNSFFAGHPGLVATSTFFAAKVFSDYHPDMKNKWVLYSIAGAAATATGLLRIKAGEHFPSDVMVGIPVGVLTGILVPHFHKNKALNPRLSFYPAMGANGGGGFTAVYKLGNRK
jgi:membrane-associated phospholipid phosphatase